MTAERWWVRRGARWVARVKGVEGQLRLAMLGLTGLSTATLTLQQYGYARLAWPLIATVSVGMLGYTYLYTEGGVWNQANRDTHDLSSNYVGPKMRIDDELIARGVLAAQKGRALEEEEREAIREELDAAWDDYRDGLEIES